MVLLGGLKRWASAGCDKRGGRGRGRDDPRRLCRHRELGRLGIYSKAQGDGVGRLHRSDCRTGRGDARRRLCYSDRGLAPRDFGISICLWSDRSQGQAWLRRLARRVWSPRRWRHRRRARSRRAGDARSYGGRGGSLGRQRRSTFCPGRRYVCRCDLHRRDDAIAARGRGPVDGAAQSAPKRKTWASI